MTDITLTDTQSDAVKRTKEWYQQCAQELADKKPLTQQVWRVFGLAGTGKSTVIKYMIEEIGGDINVLSGAFTGKAARVLTKKGTPTTTIHSMCYKVFENSKDAIDKVKQELSKLVARCPDSDSEKLLWQSMVREREQAIRSMHRPSFMINPDSPIRDCDLVILEEVSMVNFEMAADIMSFGKPILVLGDPGQLKPIRGEGAFNNDKPDVLLTEIHRQAAESPIIILAMMAREGKFIPFGQYSENVFKMHRGELKPKDMLSADQIGCGFNSTRFALNNGMRKALGFDGLLPQSSEEKIICLKNQNDIGLVNGMFLSLSDCDTVNQFDFKANVITEDGSDLGRRTIYKGNYDDHVSFDKDRGYRDTFRKKGLVETTYGNACTIHKLQGSGFKNFILYDDGFGRGEDRNLWMYTGITRAEEGLIILG